jgi:hypothetical protein
VGGCIGRLRGATKEKARRGRRETRKYDPYLWRVVALVRDAADQVAQAKGI